MKHLQLYENYFLNELFVHGDEDVEGKTVIQYKAYVWVLDQDSYEQHREDLAAKTGIDEEDYWDFMNQVEEEKNYIFRGRIESPYLVIPSHFSFRHSKFSPDVRKVMKQFGLTDIKIEYTEYTKEKEIITTEEPVESLKSATFYHGTCMSYVESIKTKGLAPLSLTNAATNYEDVTHKDKVFITLNREKAYSHAMNAARKKDSFPMILEMRVPDVSKLVPDYDVAIQHGYDDEQTSALGYRDIADETEHKGNNHNVPNISKKFGIFGYVGRIPASYITGILIDTDGYENYISYSHFGDSYDFEEQSDNLTFDIDDWQTFRLSEITEYMSRVVNELAYEGDEEHEDEDEDEDEDEEEEEELQSLR